MIESESIESKKIKIDEALLVYLKPIEKNNISLYKAMRYTIFPGGKRFRPILVLISNELCGGNIKGAIPAACAIEMIHAFSLIQDDLPMMDNADVRRGKPSCHKQFGESTALLAGDALLALAFELLAKTENVAIVHEVSVAIGYRGMVWGQFIDLKEEKVNKIYSIKNEMFKKTTALVGASAKIGGMLADASISKINSLNRYGEYLGLSYQLLDDLKDEEGIRKSDILTELEILRKKIRIQINAFGKEGKPLIKFADYVVFNRLATLNLNE